MNKPLTNPPTMRSWPIGIQHQFMGTVDLDWVERAVPGVSLEQTEPVLATGTDQA